MADKLKLAVAALILGGALGAFYYFGDYSAALRVIGLLVAVAVAAFVALQSQPGAELASFGRGAVIEVRKVVWPSRKETTQTTLVVLAMVIFMGLVMWGFDSILAFLVRWLTG
jgi:preprotein translocase subunit SecE